MLKKSPHVMLCLLTFFLMLPQAVSSAPLLKSSAEMMKKVNLDPSMLADVDKELQVPQEWIEKAKKEGNLRVRSTPLTPRAVKTMLAPFKERYPFIDVSYFGANRQGRTIKTLMAYRAGRILSDLVMNIGSFVREFQKVGGLENLGPLPGLKNVPDEFKDPKDTWTGLNKLYWCMSYNTKLVSQHDLPKRWEDIITEPRWRKGNLALGNRPNLWAANLWMAKGERWTKDFLTQLFTEVKPQLRKEGMNALTQLIAAGEFHSAIPSNHGRAQESVLEGAPVSFFCPEPVPASVGGTTIIFKESPNVNAAKIFVNWLLSKEGQIALFASMRMTPVHLDVQRKELLPFADQILGKKQAFREPRLESKVMPPLFDFWNALWLKGGGTARRR